MTPVEKPHDMDRSGTPITMVKTHEAAWRCTRLTEPLQAFENTSTNIAAAQMRNALTSLAETVKEPEQKRVRIHRLGLWYCRGPFSNETCLSCSRRRWTTSLLCSGGT